MCTTGTQKHTRLAVLLLPSKMTYGITEGGHLVVAAFRVAAAHNACAADAHRLPQLLEGLDAAGVVLALGRALGVVNWVHQIRSLDALIPCTP